MTKKDKAIQLAKLIFRAARQFDNRTKVGLDSLTIYSPSTTRTFYSSEEARAWGRQVIKSIRRP